MADWTPGPFSSQGTDGAIEALATWDDARGSALYAAGSFIHAGRVEANRVACGTGTEWRALASGLNGSVRALAVFDDGRGPALYAGGEFSAAGGQAVSNVAR